VVAKRGSNSVYDANPNNFCWAPATGGSVFL
jgi:hypothetical protein